MDSHHPIVWPASGNLQVFRVSAPTLQISRRLLGVAPTFYQISLLLFPLQYPAVFSLAPSDVTPSADRLSLLGILALFLILNLLVDLGFIEPITTVTADNRKFLHDICRFTVIHTSPCASQTQQRPAAISVGQTPESTDNNKTCPAQGSQRALVLAKRTIQDICPQRFRPPRGPRRAMIRVTDPRHGSGKRRHDQVLPVLSTIRRT